MEYCCRRWLLVQSRSADVSWNPKVWGLNQACRRAADSSPVVSLCLSLVARVVWWEGGKRRRETFSLFPSHQPLLTPRAIREDDWGRIRAGRFILRMLLTDLRRSQPLCQESDTLKNSLLVRFWLRAIQRCYQTRTKPPPPHSPINVPKKQWYNSNSKSNQS